jgi:hypothetical protein
MVSYMLSEEGTVFYLLDRRLGEAHSQSGTTNEEKNSFLCQKSKHGHPAGAT